MLNFIQHNNLINIMYFEEEDLVSDCVLIVLHWLSIKLKFNKLTLFKNR
jgi:hypothetical protein